MSILLFKDKIVDQYVAHKWSEKSSKKMHAFLAKPQHMTVIIVEMGAECNSGRSPCIGTYKLEADGFVIAVAHFSLCTLDDKYDLWEASTNGMPLLKAAARQAMQLMEPVFAQLEGKVAQAQAALAAALAPAAPPLAASVVAALPPPADAVVTAPPPPADAVVAAPLPPANAVVAAPPPPADAVVAAPLPPTDSVVAAPPPLSIQL